MVSSSSGVGGAVRKILAVAYTALLIVLAVLAALGVVTVSSLPWM